jgi:nickel/cobalt transporter (NicO) family protein
MFDGNSPSGHADSCFTKQVHLFPYLRLVTIKGEAHMYSIITGTILVSIFHALIPSHWLPLLAISRKNNWSANNTLWVTFYMGLAHVVSTVLVGVCLSLLGKGLYRNYANYFDMIAPVVLCSMGIFFIYRHYKHHHFHLNDNIGNQKKTRSRIIVALVALMFFSPCLEVEGFFLVAGKFGWQPVLVISIIYMVVSIIGMLLWMRLALHGIKKLDWHRIEHSAGLFTGFVLILTGIFSYLIH